MRGGKPYKIYLYTAYDRSISFFFFTVTGYIQTHVPVSKSSSDTNPVYIHIPQSFIMGKTDLIIYTYIVLLVWGYTCQCQRLLPVEH